MVAEKVEQGRLVSSDSWMVLLFYSMECAGVLLIREVTYFYVINVTFMCWSACVLGVAKI
jgi:hypothetical protein